jgi:hypothetical protein
MPVLSVNVHLLGSSLGEVSNLLQASSEFHDLIVLLTFTTEGLISVPTFFADILKTRDKLSLPHLVEPVQYDIYRYQPIPRGLLKIRPVLTVPEENLRRDQIETVQFHRKIASTFQAQEAEVVCPCNYEMIEQRYGKEHRAALYAAYIQGFALYEM